MSETPLQNDAGLDEIIAGFLEAEEVGRPVSPEEVIAAHPQFADELRSFFADRDLLRSAARPLADAIVARRPVLGQIRYFGDYELLEEIARGGMGVVYKARQTSLNRIVAVKMILAGHLASEVDVQRFQTEAEAAARLQHPNIVSVHEVGRHDGQCYFSMDYVEGKNLAELTGDHPLPARDAARYVAEIAGAIHHAHQQGTLHRDLKPSNVLIDAEDRARITDFGLAVRIDGDSRLTLSGQAVGTPPYMPPEQAQGKRGLIGPASDIYSLGAVLYELLTGRPPFRGATSVETVRQVIDDHPVSPRLLNSSVPADIETICLKCLEKEPHRRYATAQFLADDLQRYLEGKPILARPVSRVARLWSWCRRRPLQALLSGALMLATVALIVVLATANIMITDALDQRTEALAEARLQQQATETALKAEQTALAAKQAALSARDTALKREQWQNYARGIQLVQRECEAGNLAEARKLLDECGPAELRGFEWHCLHAVCRSPLRHEWKGRIVRPTTPFTANGRLVSQIDGECHLYDAAAGRVIDRFPLPKFRNIEAVSPDGRRLALLSQGAVHRDLMILELPGGRHIRTIPVERTEFVRNVFFSRDGEQVAAIVEPRADQILAPAGKLSPRDRRPSAFRVWDIENGRSIRSTKPQGLLTPANSYKAVAFGVSNSLQLLATPVGVVDTVTGQPVIVAGEPVVAAAFNHDATLAALSTGSGLVTIWDVPSRVRLASWPVAGNVRALAFQPGSSMLAAGCTNGSIFFRDARSGHEVAPLKTGAAIRDLAFSPESGLLVSGHVPRRGETAFRIWETPPRGRMVLSGARSRLVIWGRTAAFSPDGRLVALLGAEHDVVLHDAATGALVRRITGSKRKTAEVLEDRTLLTGLVMDQSVFSTQQFADNIEEQVPVDLTGINGVVGYSYAIIDGDPAAPIADAGGNRRMPWDPFGALSADPTERQEVASIAKTFTAVAALHLLQQEYLSQNENPDSGELESALLTAIDEEIVNYLPQTWANAGWAPGFNNITIRQLMTHTSGLRNSNAWSTPATVPGYSDPYSYSQLQLVSQFGNVDTTPPPGGEYWTNNYSWFRVMIPYMWDEINNSALDANASNGFFLDTSALTDDDSLRDDLVDAMQEDWNASFLFGTDILVITPDRVVASIYKYYVSTYILEPSGIVDPQWETPGTAATSDFTLLYQIGAPNGVPGIDTDTQSFGTTPGGQLPNAGPRGLRLAAIEVAQGLHGIRHGAVDGSTILEQETMDLMDSLFLGWREAPVNAPGSQTPAFTGIFGRYLGHDGVNFPSANVTTPSGNPTFNTNNTQAMVYPNGVEAVLLINSQIQAGPAPFTRVIGGAFNVNSPAASGPTAIGTSTITTMVNAYDNAWIELVYDGDNFFDGVFDQNDTFLLALNPNSVANPNGPQYIDFFHDNLTTPVFTRRVDTLTKLTINSNGGVDTFFLQDLPAGLEVVINGGSGVNIVTVGGPQGGTFNLDNTPGTLTFNGGDGFNQLIVDDSNETSASTYFVRDDEVTRGTGTYHYNNVHNVTLNAGVAGDDIFVESSHAGTITNIFAQGGQDTITVGSAHIDFIDGLVNIVGGTDSDLVRFSDIFSGSGHHYEIDAGATVIDNSVTIVYDVEDLELYAGLDDDTIDVDSLNADQTLVISTSLGQNDVNVNLMSNPLTTGVLGEVTVHGGSGDDDTLTVNDSNSLIGTDYTVTSSTVSRPGIEPVTYDGIDDLNLDGAIPASTYDIRSTSANTNVTGGILGDTFDVGFLLRLNFIDGFLTINGGGNLFGEDTVEIDDRLGNTPLYGLVNNALFGFSFATIFLNDIEQATIRANGLDNQILIENADGPTRYTVNGGFGVDSFSVAEGTGNLMNIATPLTLHGGPEGENHLFLYDESSPGSLTYTVTENSIDRLFFGERSIFNPNIGVTFHSMTDVELHMNDNSTTVNVQSTNPATEYRFHGNDGSDTLNLNRHLDDATDKNILIDGTDITGENIDIEYHQFEQLNLNLGDERTRVRVEELDTPADLNLGGGNDRVIVTPNSRNLSNIDYTLNINGQGGRDRLILHDQNFGGNAHYTITHHTVDRLFFGPVAGGEPGARYENVEFVRLFMSAHDDVVDIDSTSPVTKYDFRGRRGNDTFNVNLPPLSPVTLRGGNGVDSVNILGTAAGDEVSVSVGPGNADVNLINIENASFDGLGGTDVLVFEGIAGVDEHVTVESSTTAHHGALLIVAEDVESEALSLAFDNTELLDLLANLNDDDTATFAGTNQADRSEVDLAAAGTTVDPVLQLFGANGGVPLLSLRDYRNFDTLGIAGRNGADEFNVHVAPEGPGTRRNLSINGGNPTGGNSGKDELTVFVEKKPKPTVDHDRDNQNNSGSIDIDYSVLHQFFIEYSQIEKAVVKSAAAAN
eukprot:g26727.t1